MAAIVQVGDRVRDQLDGRIRTVTSVRHYDDKTADVFLSDGGVMGLDDCTEVYLPSEDIPDRPFNVHNCYGGGADTTVVRAASPLTAAQKFLRDGGDPQAAENVIDEPGGPDLFSAESPDGAFYELSVVPA